MKSTIKILRIISVCLCAWGGMGALNADVEPVTTLEDELYEAFHARAEKSLARSFHLDERVFSDRIAFQQLVRSWFSAGMGHEAVFMKARQVVDTTVEGVSYSFCQNLQRPNITLVYREGANALGLHVWLMFGKDGLLQEVRVTMSSGVDCSPKQKSL